MDKTTKTVLKATALVAGAAGVTALATYGVTCALVQAAMDRQKPRVLQNADKIFAGALVSEEVRRFMEQLAQDAQTLAAREDVQRVEMTAQDGVKLIGHFRPAKEPKRLLIAMHGWRSSWSRDFGMIADFWYNSGCSVLYVEQRGQNESGGDCMGFGLTERFDARDWANYAVEHLTDGTLPIYLCGVSMGATTVLMATGLDLPEQVHGVMADCAFTSPDAIWRHVANKNLHLIYDLHRGFADALCREKLRVGLTDYSTIDALKTAVVPVVFVHGTDDHFVPVRMTYENYKACASPKRLLIVPGADHGMSYYIDREQYERQSLAFWDEFDAVTPPRCAFSAAESAAESAPEQPADEPQPSAAAEPEQAAAAEPEQTAAAEMPEEQA